MNEKELQEQGFELTPNMVHTGQGTGKLYEKIVDGVRSYKVVNPDGSVGEYESKVGIASTPEVPIPVPEKKKKK